MGTISANNVDTINAFSYFSVDFFKLLNSFQRCSETHRKQ